VLLIAASILAARKLAQYDSGKRVPATVAAISDAVVGPTKSCGQLTSVGPTPRVTGRHHEECRLDVVCTEAYDGASPGKHITQPMILETEIG
jgi:hypothetical protein